MSELPDRLAILPVGRPVVGSIRPPGSKSITNRALVCAALARGSSELQGALASEDTHVMVDSLQKLGIEVEHQEAAQRISIHGTGGEFPVSSADLFVGNSGTTIRFLTAMLATGHGRFRLDGVERMRARPIGDLVSALGQLGASVTCEQNSGFPPILIHANGLAGGKAVIRGDISSQFLSGLLLASPYARTDVELAVEGELVSKPYVAMTIGVMAAFQVQVNGADFSRLKVSSRQRYQGCTYSIEPDASAASYFWAAAAITGGRVTVEGLTRNALQGDVAFCECLAQMGCTVEYGAEGISVTGAGLRGVDVDMNAISDTAQTLAAVALFAEGPTTIRGVSHIRHKETDRIRDLACELRKLGASVDERPDGLTITPQPLRGAVLDTYRDHRMAMSLALVGLRVAGVVIQDPGCVSKTYPRFFTDLDQLVRPHS